LGMESKILLYVLNLNLNTITNLPAPVTGRPKFYLPSEDQVAAGKRTITKVTMTS
jgi:hypothetical protein